ncbi:hypothetical protein SESBI_17865 [Sesbania bispinosa]|nr:hypothetical protein SESBI_17865 [Sesbania bispinosa]
MGRKREKSITQQSRQLGRRLRGGGRERQREDPTGNPRACIHRLSCTFLRSRIKLERQVLWAV